MCFKTFLDGNTCPPPLILICLMDLITETHMQTMKMISAKTENFEKLMILMTDLILSAINNPSLLSCNKFVKFIFSCLAGSMSMLDTNMTSQ